MADKINKDNMKAIIGLVVKCNKCGHVWIPMSPTIPNYCPRCKSRNWYS